MTYAFLIVNHCLLVEMRDLTYAMADISEGISMIKLWMPVFIIFINANLIHNIFALIKNIAKISESLELKANSFLFFRFLCINYSYPFPQVLQQSFISSADKWALTFPADLIQILSDIASTAPKA